MSRFSGSFHEASANYHAEVDTEATRLIEECGYAPFEALEKAARIIKARRQKKVDEKSQEEFFARLGESK